jgi:hypothetical protein
MSEPQLIDLMTDLHTSYEVGTPPLIVIHIVARGRGDYDVIANERIADRLTYGEMLEQVMGLLPAFRKTYPTLSREELAQRILDHEI